jgi:hypothetical protein
MKRKAGTPVRTESTSQSYAPKTLHELLQLLAACAIRRVMLSSRLASGLKDKLEANAVVSPSDDLGIYCDGPFDGWFALIRKRDSDNRADVPPLVR